MPNAAAYAWRNLISTSASPCGRGSTWRGDAREIEKGRRGKAACRGGGWTRERGRGGWLRFPPRYVITRHYPPIKSLSNNYVTVAVTHSRSLTVPPFPHTSPPAFLARPAPWAWLTSNQSVSISEPLLDDCVGNHCSRLITEIPYPLIRSNENVARY